jgi:hypothetical protein
MINALDSGGVVSLTCFVRKKIDKSKSKFEAIKKVQTWNKTFLLVTDERA